MILTNVILVVLGSSFGLMTAGGMFTVLLSVGLIPRFAGKSHTGRWILLYENAVMLGAVWGTVLSVSEAATEKERPLSEYVLQALAEFTGTEVPGRLLCGFALLLFGIFAGIFVGSLAMAIAEMLDSIPIFARRIGMRHGLGIVVSAMALGKLAGSLFYFCTGMDMFGG